MLKTEEKKKDFISYIVDKDDPAYSQNEANKIIVDAVELFLEDVGYNDHIATELINTLSFLVKKMNQVDKNYIINELIYFHNDCSRDIVFSNIIRLLKELTNNNEDVDNKKKLAQHFTNYFINSCNSDSNDGFDNYNNVIIFYDEETYFDKKELIDNKIKQLIEYIDRDISKENERLASIIEITKKEEIIKQKKMLDKLQGDMQAVVNNVKDFNFFALYKVCEYKVEKIIQDPNVLALCELYRDASLIRKTLDKIHKSFTISDYSSNNNEIKENASMSCITLLCKRKIELLLKLGDTSQQLLDQVNKIIDESKIADKPSKSFNQVKSAILTGDNVMVTLP